MPENSKDMALGQFRKTLALACGSSPFDALYKLADSIVGVKIFTIMMVDLQENLATRSFSSDAENYPVSGSKPIIPNAWLDVVYGQRRLFSANNIADIAKVFPDYELIQSLGCESVVNLPVFIDDGFVGTVNLLNEKNYYTDQRIAYIERYLTAASVASFGAVR